MRYLSFTEESYNFFFWLYFDELLEFLLQELSNTLKSFIIDEKQDLLIEYSLN